jgi:hypothetical protein
MSVKRVTDHVDVISSKMFNTMVLRFIKLLDWTGASPDIRRMLESLSPAQQGQPVDPDYVNSMVDACVEVCNRLGVNPPADLHKVSLMQWVLATDVNPLVNCIDSCVKALRGPGEIYLFNAGDWSTARNYVTRNCIIFTTWSPQDLMGGEVIITAREKRAVFAVEIDTEPYWGIPTVAYYYALYNTFYPRWRGGDYGAVEDDTFQMFLGEEAYGVFDYMIEEGSKVSGSKIWARYPYTTPTEPTSGWSYVTYGEGAVIEVPCDGVWTSVDMLAAYVNALRARFLDFVSTVRVLYLGHYVSDRPSAHACYPADVCWRQLAARWGWSLYDLRG